MKKNIFFLIFTVLIISCDNEYETVHKFSRPYEVSKEYSIYLDARNILTNIQVRPATNPESPFKIVSTDKYLFIGEMMKGVHVYEKTDSRHVNPLCFIECKYIKAFDVMDDYLYCNNFIDLLVVDIKNPLSARILHREERYFNRYYNSNWNMLEKSVSETSHDRVYQIASKTIFLSGIETDEDPAPDFSEYDQLYEDIIVDEIPDTLKVDKPHVGFTGISGVMNTFGYYSLAFCSYSQSGFHSTQSLIWNTEFNYNYPAIKLHSENEILFILSENNFYYYDYNGNQIQAKSSYISSQIIDASYMTSQKTFWFLSAQGISGELKENGQYTPTSMNIPGAEAITCVNNYIFTLGARLEIHRAPSLELVKKYPDISGSCMLKEGETLITAGKKGVLLYDISDLNNIKLIP